MIQKLMTYDGGQPLYASDLAFMQDAFLKTVNEFSKGFGDTYILYGTVDESRENCIAGAVVISGEIYSVPSELGAIGQNKLCFRYADTDERTFYDASQKKVKRTCEAYLSTDTSGAVAYIDLTTAVRIDDGMKGKLKTLEDRITALESAGSYLPRYYESTDSRTQTSAIRSSISFTFSGMNATDDDVLVFSADLPDEGSSFGVTGMVAGLDKESRLFLPDGKGYAIMYDGNRLTISKEDYSVAFSGTGFCRAIVIKKRQ